MVNKPCAQGDDIKDDIKIGKLTATANISARIVCAERTTVANIFAETSSQITPFPFAQEQLAGRIPVVVGVADKDSVTYGFVQALPTGMSVKAVRKPLPG
jgi:hypothetical protein